MLLRRLLSTRQFSTAAAKAATPSHKAVEACKKAQTHYKTELDRYLQRTQLNVQQVALDANAPYLYRACTTAPNKIIEQGGWVTTDDKATIFTNGNNTGMVCFTESLDVASIFLRHKIITSKYSPQVFLYAILPSGDFYKPNGPWQQYCAAGAYPAAQGFAVRTVKSLGAQSIALEDAKFHGCKSHDFKKNPNDKQIRSFLYKNVLLLPKEENFGEDSAAVFRLTKTN